MILCACGGIIEGIVLAWLVAFWGVMRLLRFTKDDTPNPNAPRGPSGKRIPYVTGADMIKMNKARKKK